MPRTSGGAERILTADGRRVIALLGPTNTGKTHRAIQRMLSWPTGMMGLPLRLLAREVYDRVVAQRDPREVALVTGEEKRIPPDPRYWICTVEAMPVDRSVAFLAVDEVQLCADRARGHSFTDRILHARGLAETMLMGADTAGPLLRQLVPDVQIETATRFSRLSHAGHARLGSLPPRTAVIAFSVPQVYALAERIRARYGGAAVVLGALSPRTRNAQVELYQSGKVQHMVATDAIGMGLNMDIDHVAFTATRKFDGLGSRELYPAELAQIAGRAGRWRRDGSFGTTGDQEPLEPELFEAIESHRFPNLRWAWWRNSALDFSSLDALLASLAQPPPGPALKNIRGAEDSDALEVLGRNPEVAALADSEERLRLLWEVCCIPDFRKTLTGSHHDLLLNLFRHLVQGPLPGSWVADRVRRLDRTQGDMDALTTRIAYIRTWNYIAFRPGWMEDASTWQERTRELEERLSDALHEELTRRFVEQRSRVHLDPSATLHIEGDQVQVSGQPLGTLSGFRFRPHATTAHMSRSSLERAASRALAPELERRAQALAQAPDTDLSADGALVRWQGRAVARLRPGPSPTEPRVLLLADEVVPARARRVARARVEDWVESRVQGLLAPMARLDLPLQAMQALQRGLGTTAGDLDVSGRAVRRDPLATWVPALLSPGRLALRAWLASLHLDLDPHPPPPRGEPLHSLQEAPEEWWWAVGHLPLRRWALRVDLAHRLGDWQGSAQEAADLLRQPRSVAVEVLTELRVRRREVGYGSNGHSTPAVVGS